MTFEISSCPPERLAELLKTAEIGFAEDVSDDLIERVRTVAQPERFVCAIDAGRFVATGGVFGVKLSVPGGELPAGGVTWVTVLPSHRRRGILRGLMRLMIDDCHARNEPLAMLWASEGAIYQRFGYGLATVTANLDAEKASSGWARQWPREGQVRLLPAGEGRELISPVYEAVAKERAGFLSRTPDWWVGQLPLADKDSRGGESKRLAVYETDAGVEAYAIYKGKAEWDRRGPGGAVTVEEAVATTARGTREIWRFLFDIDLMRTLRAWRLPTDHPVFYMAAELRRLGVTMGDGLWLRIVDAGRALEGRTYGVDGRAEGRLTFELRDDYCPWNAGLWTLDVTDGRAKAGIGSAPADLAMDANDLGALYMGGVSATTLARAGRVEELRSGGLAAADRLFRTALAPWCPQEF
jgi:predicted acetyltransferase